MKGNKRRDILKGMAVGTGAVTLAGCLGGNGGDGGGETLRIGVTQPQSGPYAAVGESNVAVTEAVLNQWSDETGVEIEYHIEDTETDPTTATQVARELISQEDVHMLTGSYSSAVALAINEVANEESVPYVSGPGSQTFSGEECQPYGFALNITTSGTGRAMALYALENLGSSFYTLTHNYVAGQTGRDATHNIIEENGGTIEGDSLVDLGQTDMSSELTSAVESGADVLITNIYGDDLATVIGQAAEFGVFEEMEVGASSLDLAAILDIELEEIQGLYGSPMGWWTLHEDTDVMADIEERLGRYPGMACSPYIGGAWTALDVMTEIDSFDSSEQFVEEMRGREWSRKPYGEDAGGQYYRECDHRSPQPGLVMEAKSPGDARNEYDLLELLEMLPPDELFLECENTGCDMADP